MVEQELEILQGTIGAVVFQNYDNGYAVLRLRCSGGDAVTVVGIIGIFTRTEIKSDHIGFRLIISKILIQFHWRIYLLFSITVFIGNKIVAIIIRL